jgi:predicted ATPase/DNA-binding XRE family transcriptional regulator
MDEGQGASFGERLRRLREAAGLTQEELAERAGLTAKGVGALERGDRRRPYPHTVRSLGTALGLSADGLAKLATTVPRRGTPNPTPATAAEHVVPALPAPLVGRGQDAAAVVEALGGEGRLLTLTGTGGVGKTSLALEVGHRLSNHFPGGVAFVSLSQLDDPGLLLDNIAHALGLRESAGRSLREVLKAALRDRQLLIILDNFEHLTRAATDVAELLAMCPRVQVLITSRSPLRIRGERELPVRPLALPDPQQPPTINSLVDVPSVQLFVQRAEAVSPSFELTEANADTVAAICRRLDGLPLAIELAAARIRLLSPTALLSKLDQLLPVLTGGPRDLPARQQTVRASVAWSYDLLEESERKLFRGISVFAGDWTIEGAEAVAPEIDILSDLGRLVEASLVVRQPEGDRYRMLEPIREFAAGELGECGESHEVRDGHAAYYLALAEEAELGLKGQGQLHWLQRLDEEHDNLRTALSWLLSRAREGIGESGESTQRLTATLSRFWFLRGHWSEGRGWLKDALSVKTGDQLAARAKALDGAGLIAQFQNDYQRATAYLKESLALYQTLGDQNGVASALTKLGFLAAFQNDGARVDELHAAIAPMESQLEDKSTIGYLLIFLGLAAVIRGEIEKGIDLHDQALSIFRKLADVHGMVWCLTNLGLLKMVTGELRSATTVLQEDLGLAVQLGEPASIQYALLGLATVASQEDRPERAARLWGAAEAIRAAAGMELNPLARAQTMYDTWVYHARNEAGAESFAKVWAEGSAMSLEQTLSYALSPAE